MANIRNDRPTDPTWGTLQTPHDARDMGLTWIQHHGSVAWLYLTIVSDGVVQTVLLEDCSNSAKTRY